MTMTRHILDNSKKVMGDTKSWHWGLLQPEPGYTWKAARVATGSK